LRLQCGPWVEEGATAAQGVENLGRYCCWNSRRSLRNSGLAIRVCRHSYGMRGKSRSGRRSLRGVSGSRPHSLQASCSFWHHFPLANRSETGVLTNRIWMVRLFREHFVVHHLPQGSEGPIFRTAPWSTHPGCWFALSWSATRVVSGYGVLESLGTQRRRLWCSL